MLLHDDVVADGEAKASAFSGRLGREEWVEYLFFHISYAAIKRGAAINGDYEPSLAASTKNLGDRVEIKIRDNGTGIANAFSVMSSSAMMAFWVQPCGLC